MANRSRRTVKSDTAFFLALSEGAPVHVALASAGYRHRTVYEWREADDAFRHQWEDAIARAVELMEREADRRALEGVLEPVYYKGVVVGAIRKYSDVLLIFRLKALAPDKYRERVTTEVTGKDGAPFKVVFEEPK